jgi:hypothetical protein
VPVREPVDASRLLSEDCSMLPKYFLVQEAVCRRVDVASNSIVAESVVVCFSRVMVAT